MNKWIDRKSFSGNDCRGARTVGGVTTEPESEKSGRTYGTPWYVEGKRHRSRKKLGEEISGHREELDCGIGV